MTIDERGNLYFTGLGGVWIVSPTGQQLDMINVPIYNCSNICFGGPENKTLYITCQDKVYSLDMVVRGGE
jgi:gluconolactonase